ncbi:MAG: hypothetical protein WC903_01220 [Candidatus Margulisiibacteriota bacterium]
MDNEEIIKLDPSLVEDGKTILKALDNTEIKPSAALWFYFEDLKSWRLIISSPYFNNKTPQECYREVLENIQDQVFVRLYIGDISLFPTNENLVNLLKLAVRTAPLSIAEIRFTSSIINGLFIRDALIYRIS